jgi:SAM-dependent methyltransferase
MSPWLSARPSTRLSDLWKAPLHDFPIRDELLYQYLPLGPDMDVLEVGPGSGNTAFRMARRVNRLTVLDMAPGNISRLRVALGDQPSLSFVCADICQPRLANSFTDRFDAIYAIEVLELVPDAGAALRNMAALLRPGGQVLIQFPNYPPPRNPGITYFRTRAELDHALQESAFSHWSLYSLRLTPYAQALFNAFHERPLALYRRLRLRTGQQHHPLAYDQTWAFQGGHRLGPYKPLLHGAWMALSAVMRLGGDCFERTPLKDEILNRNLLLLAVR